MGRERNSRILSKMRDMFAVYSGACVLKLSVGGFDAEVDSVFRDSLRRGGAKALRLKNSLSNIVFQELGFNFFCDDLQGEVVLVYFSDSFSCMRFLVDFSKKYKAFSVSSGLEGGRYISADDVKVIASLNSVEQVYVDLLYSVLSPVMGCSTVLISPLQCFFRVLQLCAESKSSK